MISKQWFAIGLLALLPFAATAQQTPQQPNPLDTNAPVVASTYASALKDYQAVADEQESPDKIWRAANAEVAKLGGHAGHVKHADAATSSPAQPREKLMEPTNKPANVEINAHKPSGHDGHH